MYYFLAVFLVDREVDRFVVVAVVLFLMPQRGFRCSFKLLYIVWSSLMKIFQ